MTIESPHPGKSIRNDDSLIIAKTNHDYSLMKEEPFFSAAKYASIEGSSEGLKLFNSHSQCAQLLMSSALYIYMYLFFLF